MIDYPTNPYNFPEEGPVVVKRDGEHQGQSVAYATTYGGYTVEKEES